MRMVVSAPAAVIESVGDWITQAALFSVRLFLTWNTVTSLILCVCV